MVYKSRILDISETNNEKSIYKAPERIRKEDKIYKLNRKLCRLEASPRA